MRDIIDDPEVVMIDTILRYTRFAALLFLLATAFMASRQSHAADGKLPPADAAAIDDLLLAFA